MAYYKYNGTPFTSIFSTNNTSLNTITTNYKQSGTDIQNQFAQIFSTDSSSLNSAYQHVNNTYYNINGVDIKTKFLPYYQEFTTGSGTITIPIGPGFSYIKCMLIGGGGGGGGGDNGFYGDDFDAGSSGGGGSFVDTGPIYVFIGNLTLNYSVGAGGVGGSYGSSYNWIGGNGTNGGDTTITYNGTTYRAGGGGKGYGGNGNGSQYGVGGIAYGSSSLNRNGSDGLLGRTTLNYVNDTITGVNGGVLTPAYYIANGFQSLFTSGELVGGIPNMGANSGFINYNYQNIQSYNYGLGGGGGFGSKSSYPDATSGINGNGGYIRINYCV